MHTRHPLGPATRLTLIALFVVSLVGLLLPREWTARFISLVQVMVPFLDGAGSAMDSLSTTLTAGGTPSGDRPPPSADVHQSIAARRTLQRERKALRNQVAALSVQVSDLEREVALLTATRGWNAAGQPIGSRGRLIPAKVIHSDLLAWRDSRLITAGMLQGVHRGSPVIAEAFTINQGSSAGFASGSAVVLGSALIGFVEQIGTRTARVKLVSDVSVQMKVRLGRFGEGQFTPLEGAFWLVGRGRGVMEVRDLDRRDVHEGLMRVGDIVLSDPEVGPLPAAMVIGRITQIDADHENPLLAIAIVQADAASLSATPLLERVYVFDPDDDVEDGKGVSY